MVVDIKPIDTTDKSYSDLVTEINKISGVTSFNSREIQLEILGYL